MITQQGPVIVTGEQEVTVSIDGAPVSPFEGVTLTDPTPGATDTVTIDISAAQGKLTDGPGFTGLTSEFGYGTESPAYVDIKYTLPSGTPSQISAELDALVFTPSAYSDTMSPVTGLLLTATSREPNTGLITESDFQTTTTETEVQVVPIRSVSLDGGVSYGNGIFTLTGTASAIAGVSSVEISALVDGARQDLGAATVNADGTFTFADAIGDKQTVFVATLTDQAGGQATSQDSGFNLTGGLGPDGETGKEESFNATEQVSTVLFRPNGQRFVGIEAPGAAVDLQPYDIVANHHQGGTDFVFSPGNGIDVVQGFKVGGADHDTIDLPSSDFRNFAAVLRNTGDVGGSAFITDPKTGDAIRLAGVTTAELKAHPKDFSFG